MKDWISGAAKATLTSQTSVGITGPEIDIHADTVVNIIGRDKILLNS